MRASGSKAWPALRWSGRVSRIISYPMALSQASEAGRPVEAEIDHLLVHGVLHLLGYDHAEAAEEEWMRARERELLAALS